MHWIALRLHEDATPDPTPNALAEAWGWHALRFTPHVAWLEEALVLETSASQRLWGGRRSLLHALLHDSELPPCVQQAEAATALLALAHLRWRLAGPPGGCEETWGGPAFPHAASTANPSSIDALPLATLSAAHPHLETLERIGCRTWGALRALPRAGVARRFGAALLDALDAAYGLRPEPFAWLTLPPVFDQNLELPALATDAPALLWTAQRLLAQLQAWLRACQRGVLAVQLEWTLDLRRLDGVQLSRHGRLEIRTAEPTQDIAHLRRLMAEHLERTPLAAPANHLRLRTLETTLFDGRMGSLLPDEQRRGESLHAFVERVSARLGPARIRVPLLQADHRPEHMQRWVPATEARTSRLAASTTRPRNAGRRTRPTPSEAACALEATWPAWLLPQPVPLRTLDDIPLFEDAPLQLLSRPQRLETGWWDGRPTQRDYFIARSAQAGLLWIYRDRPPAAHAGTDDSRPPARWYLQGVYACA